MVGSLNWGHKAESLGRIRQLEFVGPSTREEKIAWKRMLEIPKGPLEWSAEYTAPHEKENIWPWGKKTQKNYRK